MPKDDRPVAAPLRESSTIVLSPSVVGGKDWNSEQTDRSPYLSPAPTVPDVPGEYLDDDVEDEPTPMLNTSAPCSTSPMKPMSLDGVGAAQVDDRQKEPTQKVPSSWNSLAPVPAHPKKMMDLDGVDADQVPTFGDDMAPRFDVGEHHISENAIRQRAKRIFTPRVDGSLKVSEAIFNEWKSKGQARRNLEQIFKSVGYDPDP